MTRPVIPRYAVKKLLLLILLGVGSIGTSHSDENSTVKESVDVVREKYCATKKDREAGFLRFLQDVGNIREKIEQIPPDIATYLESERKASIFPPNERRYAILISHRFYYPWRLRKQIGDFLLNSDGTGFSYIGLNDRQREVKRYIDALENLGEVDSAFSDYAKFDEARQPRVVSKDDVLKYSVTLPFYRSFFGDLAVCAAR